MKILALDTACSACSVALWNHDAITAKRFMLLGRGHAEALAPMIAAVLAEAGIAACSVDRFAVTVGPGAFTGLRVGLATARGLALATGHPLVGITTFEAVAHGLTATPDCRTRVLIAIDSRRAEVFTQRFHPDLTPWGEPAVLTPEATAAALPPGPWRVAGDGSPALRHAFAERPDVAFDHAPGLPDAVVVAARAAALWPGLGLPPRPLYLRLPDVTLPTKGTAP